MTHSREHVARSLVEDGRAEVALVSLGAAGVLLVSVDVVERI
jgi:hypothetical protein